MPSFRARHLFRRNIKTAEDIVSIGCEAVTKLLVRTKFLLLKTDLICAC